MIFRRKAFSADLQRIMNTKKSLPDLYEEHGATRQEVEALHDAYQDCKAICKIMKDKHISFSAVTSVCRSFESVEQRAINPLLRAGLVTKTVAAKLGAQITCENYFALSDEQLSDILKAAGLTKTSMDICQDAKFDIKDFELFLQCFLEIVCFVAITWAIIKIPASG